MLKFYRLWLGGMVVCGLLLSWVGYGSAWTTTTSLGTQRPPSPEQFTLTYRFVGVMDTAGANINAAATVIHCSNIEPLSTEIWVELDDELGNTYELNVLIQPNETTTIATQETLFFEENEVMELGNIGQGNGRIYVENGRFVVCNVQLVDPTSATPAYLTGLPLLNSVGWPIGTPLTEALYLPLIQHD